MKTKLHIQLLVVLFALNSSAVKSQSFDYGTGAEGAYTAPAGTSTLSGTHNFTDFTIPAGSTVNANGKVPLILKCTGTATISGSLLAVGGNGSDGTASGGTRGISDNNGGGGDGSTGGGSGSVGTGGGTYAGTNVCYQYVGGAGGPNGDYYSSTTFTFPWGGKGGNYGDGSTKPYGDPNLTTTMCGTTILGGSGGSGGGGMNANAYYLHCGGGGGGGGGGGIQITGYTITINPGGLISVRGGNGGGSQNQYGYSLGGNGGGGSGGTVNLKYFHLTGAVLNNTTVFVPGSTIDIGGGFAGYGGLTAGQDGFQGRYLAQQDQVPCIQPVLNSQPMPLTLCTGSSASLFVDASGTNPLSFQWQKMETGSWNQLAGETTNNYQRTTINENDAGEYRCIISNQCGSATSNPANLTVCTNPVISYITGNKIKCTGDTATIKVIATGNALNYQWYKIVNSEWLIVNSATNSLYNLSSTTTADAGNYTCIVSNVCSNTTGNTNLIVETPPQILNKSDSISPCQGTDIQVDVNATGDSLTYQWIQNGQNITGMTNSSLQLNKIKPENAGIYSCNVSNRCKSVSMSPLNIQVKIPPKETSIFVTQTKYKGDSIYYSLSPSGTPPFEYQWMHNGKIIPGQTDNSYRVTSLVVADSGMYTCKITNSCDSITAPVAHLYILSNMQAISGYVKYDNSSSTPMNNTTVYLYKHLTNNDQLIDSVKTDANGAFNLYNLTDGTYTLICNTSKAWGGSNPVDALLANRNFIGVYSITDPLKKKAADVNNDNKINPIDALMINRRYIGSLKKFTNPDWLFETPTVVITGADVIQNIKAICTGDVNGSYSTK